MKDTFEIIIDEDDWKNNWVSSDLSDQVETYIEAHENAKSSEIMEFFNFVDGWRILEVLDNLKDKGVVE